MENVVSLLKNSLKDGVLSKSERRNIKALIKSLNFSERDFDLLRSKIFDLAIEFKGELTKPKLVEWLESANKLTLIGAKDDSNSSRAYFSPGEECRSAICSLINSAINNLKVSVFTISDNEIAATLVSAKKRGVDVRILTDNDKSFDMGSDIEELSTKDIKIKIDQTPNHMHHKFCIADNKVLLSGSYNWTRSAAERNQENIIITEEPSLVKAHLKEFDRLWNKLADY